MNQWAMRICVRRSMLTKANIDFCQNRLDAVAMVPHEITQTTFADRLAYSRLFWSQACADRERVRRAAELRDNWKLFALSLLSSLFMLWVSR